MAATDPEVLKLATDFIERAKNRRAIAALKAMIEQGSVSTDDLKAMGYEHPPRAIADVRDNGIPVVTENAVSASGGRMARYRLGTAQQIRVGQTGRTNFSKIFRDALLARYGARDAITGALHDSRTLQIDHRIPYRVAGDAGLATNDTAAYMLLDGKSQRTKSFSCENCDNFISKRDADICRDCFWAYPEHYSHVAMLDIRRADVAWQGDEVGDYDRLVKVAEVRGVSIAELLKELGRQQLKARK